MRFAKFFSAFSLWATLATAVDISKIGGDIIPNQYMVMLTAGMANSDFQTALNAATHALGAQGHMLRQYSFHDFRGFAVEAPPLVMDIIRNLPGVEMVEPNRVFTTSQANPAVTQRPAPYGLDRISHRANYFARVQTPEFEYYQPVGSGSTIYVVDSGIYAEHNDFGGRVTKGRNFAAPNVKNNPNTFEDFTGHGTHVASIAAGYDYGVAKRASIIDVKVFNDNGTAPTSDIVAGIDYAANDAETRNIAASSVMNLSLGSRSNSQNTIENYAVRSATRAGILCVVAAGNSGANADDFSPANEPLACTVGNIDSTDMQSPRSNYGDSLDLWAPGTQITAAYINEGPSGTANLSGTSMAAPFVAGTAAYLKRGVAAFGTYSAQEFCQQMANIATKNRVRFQDFAVPSGPNLIVYDYGRNEPM